MALATLLGTSCASSRAWEDASHENTCAGYGRFLSEYPESSHHADAVDRRRDRCEREDWDKVKASHQLTEIRAFEQKHSRGVLAGEIAKALSEMEDATWKRSSAEGTHAAYAAFLKDWSDGAHAAAARAAGLKVACDHSDAHPDEIALLRRFHRVAVIYTRTGDAADPMQDNHAAEISKVLSLAGLEEVPVERAEEQTVFLRIATDADIGLREFQQVDKLGYRSSAYISIPCSAWVDGLIAFRQKRADPPQNGLICSPNDCLKYALEPIARLMGEFGSHINGCPDAISDRNDPRISAPRTMVAQAYANFKVVGAVMQMIAAVYGCKVLDAADADADPAMRQAAKAARKGVPDISRFSGAECRYEQHADWCSSSP